MAIYEAQAMTAARTLAPMAYALKIAVSIGFQGCHQNDRFCDRDRPVLPGAQTDATHTCSFE